MLLPRKKVIKITLLFVFGTLANNTNTTISRIKIRPNVSGYKLKTSTSNTLSEVM